MALAKRPAAHQHGPDKRHDDPYLPSPTWHSATRMRPFAFSRKRRVTLLVLALAAAYLFIKYLPTDVPSVAQRIDVRTGRSQARPFAGTESPNLEHDATPHVEPGQVYDGPVKFFHLAATLREHLYTKNEVRENILFILYDLQSATGLLSLACSMAAYNRTKVHIGLVSMRDDSLDHIKTITGIDPIDCPVYWHDARPDYSSQSSPARQEIVIKSALSHLHSTLKPSAVIIDRHQAGNSRLKRVLQAKLDSLWVPLLILPLDASQSMSWLSSLDGRALNALPANQIDIIIMPYKHSAGSLIRLLESIRNAHYAGLPLPRITVELPQHIDSFALHYLENFRWIENSPMRENKLILRRSLDTAASTPARAALRTSELFYPPTNAMSHVLLLTPDVELSPSYLHYLYFTTLEYKYSRNSFQINKSLVGISLDLPTSQPNAKMPFFTSESGTFNPLLLSQTPSSTAALYFGDMWVELQDYITHRLAQDPSLTTRIKSASEMPATHSSWLHLTSELFLARNFFMLYPSFATTPATRLATVHTELSQQPEEYWTPPDKRPLSSIPPLTDKDKVLSASDEQSPHAGMDHEQINPSTSILRSLGLKDYDLPPVDADLPLFDTKGAPTTMNDARIAADSFADQLSLQVGGCTSLDDRDESRKGRVDFLFCNE